MDEQENLNPEEMEDQNLAEDAVPLCPSCLEPCNPLDNYCPYCDSNEPINPLASYMPFVDLRFRCGMIGSLWRKIWVSDTKFFIRIIYLLTFIVFFHFFLLIGLPFVIYEKMTTRKEEPIVKQDK